MKKIEALFRREKLSVVRTALEEQGFLGATVSEVEGLATADAALRHWLVSSRELDALAYVKLELLVDNDAVYRVTEAIAGGARTGLSGDGSIYVSSVDEVIRIDTGDPAHAIRRQEMASPLAD